jgi:hypothetical protein
LEAKVRYSVKQVLQDRGDLLLRHEYQSLPLAWMVAPQASEELDTRHVAQHDLAENKVVRAPLGDDRQRLCAGAHGNEFVFHERLRKPPPLERLIFDDEHPTAADGPAFHFSWTCAHEYLFIIKTGGAVERSNSTRRREALKGSVWNQRHSAPTPARESRPIERRLC